MSGDEGQQAGGLNPQAMRLEDLARILTALGVRPVSVDMLRKDLDDGAPANPDGTINLVNYAAWLLGEMGRRGT